MGGNGIGEKRLQGYTIGVQLAPAKDADATARVSASDFKMAQGLRQELGRLSMLVRARPLEKENWPAEVGGQYRIGKQLLLVVDLPGSKSGDFGARQALVNPARSEFFVKSGSLLIGPQPLGARFEAQSYSDLQVRQLESAANVGRRR